MSYLPVNCDPLSTAHPAASLAEESSPARPSSLRIALLGYRSHPHVGGQGIYLHYLSKALAERGHEVDVISGPPYPTLDPRVKLIPLPSLDLYAHPRPFRALRPVHLKSFADLYEWWSKLSGAFGEPYCFGRRLVRYFKRHKPRYDIVHDNQSLCTGLLSLQQQGVRLIATVHHPITRDRDLALAATTQRGQRWLIKRWYSFLTMQARVVQQLDHVVTVSQQSRQDIAAAFGRPLERIEVIANGVDTALFKPLPEISRHPRRLITTASSDQPLKGLSILLRAMAEVQKEYDDLQLVVIGKLKEDGDTQKELQHLGLEPYVQFKSGISTEELVQEYAAASIAVVPSLYEGFGLPAAEAMACGIPLVCSDGGALPEVVGDAARLVTAGSVHALRDALKDLLAQPSLCAELGERGRAHILQQLSWDAVGKHMEDYYFHILEQTAPGQRVAHAHG